MMARKMLIMMKPWKMRKVMMTQSRLSYKVIVHGSPPALCHNHTWKMRKLYWNTTPDTGWIFRMSSKEPLSPIATVKSVWKALGTWERKAPQPPVQPSTQPST